MRSLMLRTAGLASFVCGASFVAAEGTLLLVADKDHWNCNSGSDLWVNALYLLGFLLIAPAVLGLHRQQSSRVPGWGPVAALLAATGSVTTGVVNAAEHCLHLPIGLLFIMSALLTVVSLAVFAVSVVRSGVFPKWMGVAILLGTLALQFAGEQGGVYGFGVMWIVVGTALLTPGDRWQAMLLGRQ